MDEIPVPEKGVLKTIHHHKGSDMLVIVAKGQHGIESSVQISRIMLLEAANAVSKTRRGRKFKEGGQQ